MIVQRFTCTAKPGYREELVELLKGWVEGLGAPGRVLTSDDWDKVEMDLEWEREEDRVKFWNDYHHSPNAEFHKKLNDLRESGSIFVRWETK
jgi:hypothetical protein